MATLTIRQLDDEVHERLKVRARENGRSLEAEVRNMLADRVGLQRRDEFVARFRTLHASMAEQYGGPLSDGTALIREIRSEE